MWHSAAVLILLLAQGVDFSAEGGAALDRGDYAAAAAQFSKAVAADPTDYFAHFNLALANSLLGKDAEAISGYRKVLELKPGLRQAELNLGVLLFRTGQTAQAVPLLEAAAREQPRDVQANLALAEALLASGELAKSEKYFRTAAEVDPSLKNLLLKLAEAFERKGQAAKAIELYAAFPDDISARERMGRLLLEENRPAEAVLALEWAVSKSPTAANRATLADAYLLRDQPDKAAGQLLQAIEMEPAVVELRLRYGRVLRDQRNYALASEQFARAARIKPDSVEAWSELASMFMLLDAPTQALEALDRVCALGAEKPGHLFLRAVMLDKLRQAKPALDNYRKFLSLSNGEHPDEEFKARQRARVLEKEAGN
jgi:tetratricopeptide (TPR) repeat protein